MSELHCRCQCGNVEYSIAGQPKLRMICHCSICQKFNQADRADVLVFKSNQIETPSDEFVDFKTYKAPPNVKRGQCKQCGQAAIEVFDYPLFPKLTMVPAPMIQETDQLPQPAAHMFYECRVKDHDDDIPKVQGFLRSQWTFFKHLFRSK